MSQMVQLALAEDIGEAEELQSILTAAGIDSALEPAVEHHPTERPRTPRRRCSSRSRRSWPPRRRSRR